MRHEGGGENVVRQSNNGQAEERRDNRWMDAVIATQLLPANALGTVVQLLPRTRIN